MRATIRIAREPIERPTAMLATFWQMAATLKGSPYVPIGRRRWPPRRRATAGSATGSGRAVPPATAPGAAARFTSIPGSAIAAQRGASRHANPVALMTVTMRPSVSIETSRAAASARPPYRPSRNGFAESSWYSPRQNGIAKPSAAASQATAEHRRGDTDAAIALDHGDDNAECRDIQRDIFLAAEREHDQHPVDDQPPRFARDERAEDEHRFGALDVENAGRGAMRAAGEQECGGQGQGDAVRGVASCEAVEQERRRRMEERLQHDQPGRSVGQPGERRQREKRRHEVLRELRVAEHRYVRDRSA